MSTRSFGLSGENGHNVDRVVREVAIHVSFDGILLPKVVQKLQQSVQKEMLLHILVAPLCEEKLYHQNFNSLILNGLKHLSLI